MHYCNLEFRETRSHCQRGEKWTHRRIMLAALDAVMPKRGTCDDPEYD
jgi:hypothetical protein